MAHAARRLIASVAAIAAAEGIPVELLALPTSDQPRVPLSVLFEAIARLELALGGPRALEEASASPEVWPGTAVFARETRSSYLLARQLLTRVLLDDMPQLQTRWEDVGPDVFTVHLSTTGDLRLPSGFASLIGGLLRCVPVFFETTPAHVTQTEDRAGFLLHVTLPPHESVPSSSVSAHLGRSDTVNAVLGMLEDRAMYRDQRQGTQQTARLLAEGFAAEGSSEDAAHVVLRVLTEQLDIAHVLLWAGPTPRERRLLASHGTRLAQSRVLTLPAGDTVIGVLELESTRDVSFAEALLPWIAGEIGRRLTRERGQAPTSARIPAAWGLTRRQNDVVGLLVSGLANKEIALALNCSTGTVEDHLTAVYRKASLPGRGALLASLWDASSVG